ncbi:hypothetical protein WJX81_000756 [Elliptochloris bilobata]|uniref:Chloride channel protein n=1 Tax=Elliptochloris bilobata TaxID=381761 RepID=A0AAW1SBY4_9CHLO
MATFDSQDFDAVENDVERAVSMGMEHLDFIVEESWRWALSFFIGLSMGTLAFLVDVALETLNTWKFDATREAIKAGGGFWAPYAVFMAFCLGFSGLSGALVAFGAPLAAGSGIPEIKTYLNGVHVRGLLGLRTLVCKLAGVALSMAGGLIAGKEGPFVHAGGIVGGGWAGMGSRTLTDAVRGRWRVRAPRRFGGYFRNDADHRDYVSIGTAAGISVAFGAPVGGLLLAIEEGSSFLSSGIFWRGFLATCTGVLTLQVLAQCHSAGGALMQTKFGVWRDLGLYDDNLALYGARYFYRVWEMPVFGAMGVAAGLLGAVYIRAHVRIAALRARYVPPRMPWRRLAEVLVVAWLTGTAFFLAAYASPCRALPPAAQLQFYEMGTSDQDIFAGVHATDSRGLKHFPRLWCQASEFSERGQLFHTPLIQALRTVMHLGETVPEAEQSKDFHISAATLWLWSVVVYVLMLATFGIGAATGIFVPSLAVGGALGRLVGMAVDAALQSAGSSLRVSLPAYAVVGAAALLGGVTRMTISITVLAMEGTGALQLIVPLMLAALLAKVVGDALSPSIYDVQIKIRGAPVLTESGQEVRQRMVNGKLSVGELASTALVALPPVVRVSALAAALRSCSHQAFPVTPEVKAALQSDAAFPLHGVMKRANASLARAYRLFRTMGLHHLYVGPPKPLVMGVITRKDVTEENAEVCLGAKAHRGLVPPCAFPPPAAVHAPLLRASSRYYEEATGVGGSGGGAAVRPGTLHALPDEQPVGLVAV